MFEALRGDTGPTRSANFVIQVFEGNEGEIDLPEPRALPIEDADEGVDADVEAAEEADLHPAATGEPSTPSQVTVPRDFYPRSQVAPT